MSTAPRREPLLRVVSRPEKSPRQVLLLRLESVLLSLAAGGIFILLIGYNPFEIYATILSGAFRSKMAVQATVKYAIPLVIASLGVTLAFRMRFWNIGAEGQIIMGAVFASYFALFHAGWNHWLLIAVMLLAGALGGAAVSACLASGGHPLAYLRFTRDVGGWQYFYFNGTGGRAMLLYLLETPRLWAFALPAAAFLAWCLTRLWQKRLTDRQLVLGFLAFAILAATGAYTVSGSGYNFKEALEGYTWLALFALAARGLVRLTRRAARLRDGALRLAAAGLALALAVLTVRDAAGWKNAEHKGEYLPALGGWCEYTRALVDAPALTGGAPVFSAYATGLETVEGTFQPTGCDYIIHALGEERRAAYLAEFERGAYPYAQTPRLELENWLTAQNWDFYRELWAGYERVSDTEYSWLWRRCGDRALPIRAQAAVEQLDGGMVQITVSAPRIWKSCTTRRLPAAGGPLFRWGGGW